MTNKEKMVKAFFRIIVAISVLALSGCSLHAINKEPSPKVAARNSFIMYEGDSTPDIFKKPWWESFERTELNNIIKNSFSKNQNVAQAIASLRQAQAITTQSRSTLFPQVNIVSNSSIQWQDGRRQRGSNDVGASVAWDIDLWNKLRSNAKSDELEVIAKEEDLEAVKLSLSIEVAKAYFSVVAARQRLSLLNKQLKLDKKLLNLLQLRKDNGVGTNVDILQQKSRVADSEKLIPLAETDLKIFENRLDVLSGQMPDKQMRVLPTENLAFTDKLPEIGVPTLLLANRPDLRAARAELVSADADIASAIADRFPKITLDGSYALSDTASFSGPISLIMSSFVQPLIDWGNRKAEVERNKALYQERLASYTQLFLEAVESVENSLIREKQQREFLSRLSVQKNILTETVDTAEGRYTQGIDDYLPVINSLQELRQVERDLISEKFSLLENRIDLFRAIGGPIREYSGEGNKK